MAYQKDKKRKNKDEDKRYLDWSLELNEFQDSDTDQRDLARECDAFLLEEDGQWEDNIARRLDAEQRPRYTFDKITPVIESMMTDIEDMDFGCNVKPAGGEANKETAETLEGMIRSIQNMSRSEALFRKSCRRVIRRGFDAWVVRARYKDSWSFEQDLFIDEIPNAVNRVWVSNTCTKEDSSDADVAYVLSSMSPEKYKKKYPKGSGISVDDSNDSDDGWDNYLPEVITIAERYYRKETMVEVALLTSGDVVELNDDFEKIKDEYAQNNIFIAQTEDGKPRTKKVKDFKWYHCAFDGGGILEPERLTVFKSCPVVTVYGNHELMGSSSKLTYSGITLKEMDAQRVHNYAKSREIEEGALAPREKLMMTRAQAKGHEPQLAKMNVSSDPVQFYNPDTLAPPPFKMPGAQINPNLAQLSNQMAVDIREQASVTDAMQGQMNGRESEEAVRMRIDRGTGATRKWVNAIVNGIQRVCELLIETIPVVYDTQRQFAIVGMDGTESMVTLNQEIYDQQSQRMIKINSLNAGKYKVVADAGPAFTNRLEAGLAAMLEYAAIDPSIVQQGGDLMLKAIDAPLVDKMAERKRAQMLQAGMIPFSQMNGEEKQQAQQMAQQPKEPDAMMIAAQAEQAKAQADLMTAQTKQIDAQIDQFNAETKRLEAMVKAREAGVKIQDMQVSTQGKQIDNMNKLAEGEGKRIDNAKKMLEPIRVQ